MNIIIDRHLNMQFTRATMVYTMYTIEKNSKNYVMAMQMIIDMLIRFSIFTH